jgi:sugar transferase (PEP-CTERM system associated)
MLELFRSPRRAIVWFVEASLLALLGMAAATAVHGAAGAPFGTHAARVLLVAAVAQASMYYHGLYGPGAQHPREMIVNMLRALLAAAAVLLVIFHFLPRAAFGGGAAFAAAFAGAAVVLPAWRAAYARVAASPLLRRNALVLGGGPLARACAEALADESVSGLTLSGVLVEDGDAPPPGARVLGGYADVARACETHRIEHIIVAAGERRGVLPVAELVELKLKGVAVEDGIELYERLTGRVFVPALKPSDLVFSRGYHVTRAGLSAKRALDVAGAAILLLLALPVMILTAIAIKLDSPGPVLYAQERLGAFGKPFRILKFRSMIPDAEAGGAAWARENDPRVTRVGKFLRRARIDELPQLWNVLAGEMSLVGPRPERPVFIERLEREIPFFRQRLAMKPGVTGHAQVRSRYGASIEDAREKLSFDLFYIKRFSVWFDLSILADTVKVVLLRIGSR